MRSDEVGRSPQWSSWSAPADGSWAGWDPDGPSRRRTDAFAIASLVLAVVALVPLAVGSAVIALARISRSRARGTGLAVAGLLVSLAWVAIAVTVTVVVLTRGGDGGTRGQLGRVADANDAGAGNCLAFPEDDGDLSWRVSCVRPHDAEVFLVQDLGPAEWPGYAALDERAEARCRAAFTTWFGQSVQDTPYNLGWFVPDEAEWRSGEHELVCAVLPADGNVLIAPVRDPAGPQA